MTPDQIRLVSQIVASVSDTDAFAVGFYQRLFAAAPETEAMFPDLDSQRVKLRDELATLLALLDDLQTLEVRARDLGERHRGYGVRAAHYQVARQAMADTLADVLGADFGPDERAAWNRASNLVSELMQTR